MSVISRGFGARRRESDDRLPPGQYLTPDFPVLSAGPTPRVSTETWEFVIVGLDGSAARGRGSSCRHFPSRPSPPTSTA